MVTGVADSESVVFGVEVPYSDCSNDLVVELDGDAVLLITLHPTTDPAKVGSEDGSSVSLTFDESPSVLLNITTGGPAGDDFDGDARLSAVEAELETLPDAYAPLNTVVRTVKADANLTLPAVNTPTWTDVDPNGSAAARPLDVVIPNVSPGDWVSFSVAGFSATAASAFYLDAWTVVDGVPVAQFGDAITGTMAWYIGASLSVVLPGGAQHKQLTEADIDNGSVRLRLRSSRGSGTAARVLNSTGGFQVAFEGRGPFV